MVTLQEPTESSLVTPNNLKNLAGFLDVLIQIDLSQKAKAKTIEKTTE